MPDLDTLTFFILAVLALLMSPGPNMAFILTNGAAYGAALGLAAVQLFVLGIVLFGLAIRLLRTDPTTAAKKNLNRLATR